MFDVQLTVKMEIRERGGCDCTIIPIPNETKWIFYSRSGVSFPIPNFLETYEKQFNKKIQISDVKWWQQTPYIGGDVGVACYITIGIWENYQTLTQFNLKHSFNIALLARTETSMALKRLEKLETWFDHIRQKSSIIDEFIKMADEVLAKGADEAVRFDNGVTMKGKSCSM